MRNSILLIITIFSVLFYSTATAQRKFDKKPSELAFSKIIELEKSFEEKKYQSFNECKSIIDDVLTIKNESQFQKVHAKANEILGDYYFLTSQFSKADSSYTNSFTYLLTVDEKFWLANLKYKLGKLYSVTLRPEEAINYLYQAHEFYRDNNLLKQLAKIEIQIGEYYRNLSNYDEAREHTNKALVIVDNLVDSEKLKMVLYNRLAAIYNETGYHGLAIEYSEKCIEIAKDYNNLFYQASSLNELGFVYEKTHQRNAKIFYDKAAKIYRKLGAIRYLAGSMVNQIRYALLHLNYNKGFELIDSLKQLAYNNNWQIIDKEILMYEAKIYHALKDYKKAFEKQQLYHVANMKILLKERANSILDIERKYDLKEKELLILNQKNQIELNEYVIKQKEKNIKTIMIAGMIFILLSVLLTILYISLRKHELKLLVTNRQLNNTILEKEALVKEIHHRVKNNLNMLSGIVLLELNSVRDQQAKSILKDVQNRLDTISLVHKQMLHPDDNPAIKIESFFDNFIENVKDSIVDRSIIIQKEFICRQVELSLNIAIPIALITNELITNSIKHAKPRGNEAIKINFMVVTEEDKISLVVEDNGQGLKDESVYQDPKTVGFKLITLLSSQLDADFRYSNNPLPKFTIQLNITDHAKA